MQIVFDTDLVVARRRRAVLRAVPGADFLLKRCADDLGERLSAVERHFGQAAALHASTATVRETVMASGKAGEVLRVEADPALLGGGSGLVSPVERLPFEPASLDLAVSLLALQEVNDLPGLLVQARRALRPDGLFLAALAGAGTLAELRESFLVAETQLHGGASPRVAPFLDVRDAGALLQRAGFALPVADLETITVRYGNPFALFADLHAMGASNALADRSRRPATAGLLKRATEIYAERFSDPDGRVRATFAIVWMSGWAPHESQQKPLRPGSAKMSLAKVLGGKR